MYGLPAGRGGGSEPSCPSAAPLGRAPAGHAAAGGELVSNEKCLGVSPSFWDCKVKSTSALFGDVPFRNAVNFLIQKLQVFA